VQQLNAVERLMVPHKFVAHVWLLESDRQQKAYRGGGRGGCSDAVVCGV
jgi:hypothetical protein